VSWDVGTLRDMSRVRTDSLAIALGGDAQRSETVYCYAGARVLEFATAVPDLGVRVETVFVTETGEDTQVTDLMVAPGESILATRRLEHHPICGDIARLRCLRDHAERVEAFLASLGCDASVTVGVNTAKQLPT
jgi:hypothetical protein